MYAQRRHGFSLLEVMVALAILVTSMVMLMEVQSSSIKMTKSAEVIITATNLATEKLTEVKLLVEQEGFGSDDIEEEGEFDDFGDDEFDLEFSDAFKNYHWQYSVSEVEINISPDIAGLAESLGGGDYFGEPNESYQDTNASNAPDLGTLGVSQEMVSEMLAPFIREIRVRVWWGDSSNKAEDDGDEVILTTHVINTGASIIPGATTGSTGAGSTGTQTSTPTQATTNLSTPVQK
jgi:prepilin-type N-terminal cleavage/methylation domain-containing protein